LANDVLSVLVRMAWQRKLERIPRAAELEVIGLRRFYPLNRRALKASMHEKRQAKSCMAMHPERLRPHLGIASGELRKIVGLIRTAIGEEWWSVPLSWQSGRGSSLSLGLNSCTSETVSSSCIHDSIVIASEYHD
jgi:hypothetical protein